MGKYLKLTECGLYLSAILFIIKLTDVIDIPYYIVFLPILWSVCIALFILIVLFIIVAFFKILEFGFMIFEIIFKKKINFPILEISYQSKKS